MVDLHIPKRREFTDRYTWHRNPDLNDLTWRKGRGEFSALTELSFEKYLDRQKRGKEF